MLKKFIAWIKRILGLETVPKWSDATLSSNWDGSNAQKRMMNILSPKMPDAVFNERVSFMKARGVNTAHVFVVNKGDGEYAGYSPFGPTFTTYSIDKASADVMTKRLKKLRKLDWAVVLWIMADDSNAWAKDVVSNDDRARRLCKAVKDLGWFDLCSTVVAGLEMDEYWPNPAQGIRMIKAIRAFYDGKIGVHHTGSNAMYAGAADILFYQIEPPKDKNNTAPIVKATQKALSYGKPVNFFELQRNPNRKFCEAALKAGAFAVGNW